MDMTADHVHMDRNPDGWPELPIGLLPESQEVRRAARSFALREIVPIMDSIDRERCFPSDLWPKMGRAGLLGIAVPRIYGGMELGYLEQLIAMEEISRVSAAVGLSYLVHAHACVNQILKYGSEEQRRRFLPGLVNGTLIGGLAITELEAGSDALGMHTRADRTPVGYRLNGHKAWIANAPCADLMIVYAKTESDGAPNGITSFVMERTFSGYRTSKARETLGLCGCQIGDISLENCEVTESNRLGQQNEGKKILLSGLALERLIASGGPLGVLQACIDIAVPYCRNRRQFGLPIGSFQLVQGKLAEMLTCLNAARAYAYATTHAVSRGDAHRFDTTALLLFVADRVIEAASETVQLFGAAGYDGESTAARLFRDAKFFSIGFGTAEIRRLMIGRDLLKGPDERTRNVNGSTIAAPSV